MLRELDNFHHVLFCNRASRSINHRVISNVRELRGESLIDDELDRLLSVIDDAEERKSALPSSKLVIHCLL